MKNDYESHPEDYEIDIKESEEHEERMAQSKAECYVYTADEAEALNHLGW